MSLRHSWLGGARHERRGRRHRAAALGACAGPSSIELEADRPRLQPLPRGLRAAPCGRRRRRARLDRARSCRRPSRSRWTPRGSTDGPVDPRSGAALIAPATTATSTRCPPTDPRPAAAAPGWRSVHLTRRDAAQLRAAPGSTSALPPRRGPPTAPPSAAAGRGAHGCSSSLGGDIAVAGPAPAEGWPVGIADGHATRGPYARSRSGRRPRHLEHHAAAGGDAAAARRTTSSTRDRRARRRRVAQGQRRRLGRAWRPTLHHGRDRPRRQAPAWLRAQGCPPDWAATWRRDRLDLRVGRRPRRTARKRRLMGPRVPPRATGAATLVLLTLTLVLGVVNVEPLHAAPASRASSSTACTAPCSLLTVALLAVHIADHTCSIGYAPIRLVDASSRSSPPIGRCGSDSGRSHSTCSSRLIVTSLLRARIGLRAWRAVHWAAYACWPIALPARRSARAATSAGWLAWLALGCGAWSSLAITVRLADRADAPRVRAGAAAALLAGALGLADVAAVGPAGERLGRQPARRPPSSAASTRTYKTARRTSGHDRPVAAGSRPRPRSTGTAVHGPLPEPAAS